MEWTTSAGPLLGLGKLLLCGGEMYRRPQGHVHRHRYDGSALIASRCRFRGERRGARGAGETGKVLRATGGEATTKP